MIQREERKSFILVAVNLHGEHPNSIFFDGLDESQVPKAIAGQHLTVAITDGLVFQQVLLGVVLQGAEAVVDEVIVHAFEVAKKVGHGVSFVVHTA